MGRRPREAQLAGKPHTPYVAGHVVWQEIGRTNDYKQAGERYRSFEDWERDDLINNLVSALQQKDIQKRLVQHLSQCDSEYSARVAAGLSINVAQPTMEPVESR